VRNGPPPKLQAGKLKGLKRKGIMTDSRED
jgi:hypothetical protein